jgi:hypothetical protein
LIQRLAVNQHIIKINHHTFTNKSMDNFIHQMHESARCIS